MGRSSRIWYTADRDTDNMIELGPVGSVIGIIIGVIVVLASIAGTLWWFWTQARDYPRQPPKYVKLVNIGLLTILPTVAVVLITSHYILLKDPYFYGPEDLGDLLGPALLLFVVLYGVFRGNFKASAKALPPVLALAFGLAAGLALVEMGRQARGKGYNDMVSSAILTDWRAIDDDTSLLTVKYETDKGKECEVSIEMDCTKFWQDRNLEYQQNADDANWDDIWGGRGNGHFYWDEDDRKTLILSEVTYSNRYNNDAVFTCRGGPTQGMNRRLEDWEENEYQEYNYVDDYYGEVAENDGQGKYRVSNILINSHVCAAGFYSERALKKEYIYHTPESAIILCTIASVVLGFVFGAWRLCPGDGVEQDTGTDFVEAPNGEAGIRREGVHA